LYDPYHDLVGVAILVDETELDHRVVALDVALDVYNLVVLQMLLDVFLEYEQGVCEVHFKRTGVVGSSLHRVSLAQLPTDQGRSPCKATAKSR
jgi:hypothetical protein